MGEMLAFAAGTQFISALISEPKKEMDAYNNAKSICDQIPIVQKQIDDISDLRTKLAGATEIEQDTLTKIVGLNSEIQARIKSVQIEQKQFSTRLLISIVVNIMITAMLGIFLFS